MTDQYTGRARITNKLTGNSREGELTVVRPSQFLFREDGTVEGVCHFYMDFTVEPILPEIPPKPGDTFTAEVTRGGETKRVMLMARGNGEWAIGNGERYHVMAEHIDRSTIESVITAKERGL